MSNKRPKNVYENQGFWYIRFKNPTKKKWDSVTTKLPSTQRNLKLATEFRNQLLEEIKKLKALEYRAGTIKEAFDHFKQINVKKSDSTKSTYKMFYDYLIQKIAPETPCITINKKLAEEFLLWLGNYENISQNTKFGIQKNFLKFLRFLLEYEYIKGMFIINRDVKIRAKVNELIKFSDFDRQLILDGLNTGDKNDNFRLMINLLMYTGLRPSDIISLTAEQIDLENMEIKFYSSKIDKWFVRPFHESLKDELSKRISEVKTGKLFEYSDVKNMGKAFSRYIKKLHLNGKGYNLRTFRKDFISRSQDSGISISAASFLVGHSSIKTTMTYYTVLSSKHLKDELKKLK
jgi:integrase